MIITRKGNLMPSVFWKWNIIENVCSISEISNLWISRTCDECCWDICTYDFQHQTLNVIICYSLNMSVPYTFIPNLKGFTSNTIQNREEPRLKCIFKHFSLYTKLVSGFMCLSVIVDQNNVFYFYSSYLKIFENVWSI